MTKYISAHDSIPNIVSTSDHDYTQDPIMYVYPIYKDFVERCALEHPSWQFRISHRGRFVDGSECRVARQCGVYAGEESLGSIGAVYFRDAPSLRVISERGDKTTKHFDIAKKAFDTLVRKKTVEEVIDEAICDCVSVVDSLLRNKRMSWRRNYALDIDFLSPFLAANSDLLMAYVTDSGKDPNIVREFLDALEQTKIVEGIQECLQKKTGAVVLLHGRKYVVTNKDEPRQTYEEHDVPDIIKRQVGMLKLVEHGQCITDLGAHIRENVFFVTLKEVV
jgi:hypothetical protein